MKSLNGRKYFQVFTLFYLHSVVIGNVSLGTQQFYLSRTTQFWLNYYLPRFSTPSATTLASKTCCCG